MTARRITIGMKPGAAAPILGEAEAAESILGPPRSPDAAEAFVAGMHNGRPAPADAWVRQGGASKAPETPEAGAAVAGMSPVLAFGASAAIGAVVAAAAIMVLSPRFAPPADPRLAAVADRVAAVELRQQQVEAGLARLNNEIAQALEAAAAAAARIEAQAGSVAEIRQMIESHAASAPEAAGDGGLTVFAVAVGQLSAAFHAGRSFEAELVNVLAMVGGDEHLRALLSELSAPARSGVPTAAMIRQELAAAAAAAGLKLGGPQGYYEYGLSMVNQYIGYASAPYAVEIATITVNDADRRLAEGDVAGAVELVRGLDPETAAPFQTWLRGAGAQVRADAAVTEMTRTVVERLRQRMGKDNAS